jgi:hypothetical protein
MSPGNSDIDDEIQGMLSLEALIKRHTKIRRINEMLNDPIYLVALDWRDVSGKKLDKVLVEYGNQTEHR